MRYVYSTILLALGAFTALSGHLISDLFGANAAAGETSHLILGFCITLFGVLMIVASLVVRQMGK